MDSEEDKKIRAAEQNGRSQTDEGPYYHYSWWEAYKGSVKGKLGGAAIGALVGAIVGVAAAPVLGMAGVSAGILAIIGTFSAAGLLYGAHEFGDVGRSVGADAALGEKLEERLKSHINKKIDQLSAQLGKNASADASSASTSYAGSAAKNHGLVEHHDEPYRTTHCDDNHCPQENRPFVFWKVALIGLAIGLAVGALLGATPLAGIVLEHIGLTHLPEAAMMASSMTTLGLFGASFGINRDIFREVFDKTDLWFKGITGSPVKTPSKHINLGAPPRSQTQDFIYEKPANAPAQSPTHPVATTVFAPSGQSTSYFTDRLQASRTALLLGFEPHGPAH